ncbi:unnamed protein product [Rotaria sordida]|uniref:PDZ domain-containing protein n=1 Tax=Rotaria sordida TaxID=392033 RepID=A0A818JYU4_9BILA|nr:unnamed protein product [Rotaria sordida]CAF3546321.1 unnamed protein product [Rotaria sordida]CAF3624877.1 unnamed protein product [Rotaria sordida]
MSSTIYDQQNSSPVVTRRPPMYYEDTGNRSQRSVNRRSLSDKIRNLFRKDSSSPKRSASNDRRTPTTSVRQSSLSPVSNRSSSEGPNLRAPTVYWPFGKKKSKLSSTTSTPTTSRTKTKGCRKTKQPIASPIEISSPIYVQDNRTPVYGQDNRTPIYGQDNRTPIYGQDNRTSIYGQDNRTPVYGQDFVPRSPDFMYGSNEGLQISINYDTPTKNYRDYTGNDDTQRFQQVIVPDADVFIPSTYTTNRSPSPSMNRQRLPNTNIEYRYQNDSSMPSVTIPLTDIEVIPTPQRKRKVGDIPPYNNTQVVVEKPPMFPQTSSRSPPRGYPSNISTNPTQWIGTSSSALNNTEIHSPRSQSRDRDVPKLNAPLVTFGGTPSKKKPKRTKSQSRADGMSGSTTTISNLVKLNPVQPSRPWASTYGSLPDAEIISDDRFTGYKPSKPSTNRYPGLSAIVWHHVHPTPVYHFDERPPTTTTTPQRTRRFDTSTTTLNDYEENAPSRCSPVKDTSTSTPPISCHDGYIRPMTPQNQSVSVDISVLQRDHDDLRDATCSSPVRRSCYDSPEPPATYRSSATIYTRDRTPCFGSGEIRTWSSQENGMNNNYNNSYKKPYTFVQVERTNEQRKDYCHHQIVPLEKQDSNCEHRYSPRYVERDLYGKQQQRIINNNDQEMDEERYEVSYVYEGQCPKYPYEAQRYYDEWQSTNRYSNDNLGIKNLVLSNPLIKTQSPMITELDNIYDQSSRSYIDSAYIQEPLLTRAPVVDSERTLHTCTLKRTDSYDGLGILISTDVATRLNHYIREVEPGSPGHKAGLRKNDRIIGINGVSVENIDFNDVLILIKEGLHNDNLQFSVIHEPEHI